MNQAEHVSIVHSLSLLSRNWRTLTSQDTPPLAIHTATKFCGLLWLGRINHHPGSSKRDAHLFQLALGIDSPWFVSASDFDAEGKRLDIEIDFKSGTRLPCPDCKAADCPVHDTTKKTWRHLDFFPHQAFLHSRTPRITCFKCGVRQVEVPWARHSSGFSLLFVSDRQSPSVCPDPIVQSFADG